MKDWRTDMSEIDNLDEVDPLQLLIYLRHLYLSAAKDLIYHLNSNDFDSGIECAQIAEGIQMGIDFHSIIDPAFRGNV